MSLAVTVFVCAMAFVIGVALLPISITLLAQSFPKGLRTMLGRVLFTVIAIANDGVDVQRGKDGDYHLVERQANEGPTFRLGKRPCGISWERGGSLYQRLTGERAATDGGEPAVPTHRLWDVMRGAGGPAVLHRVLLKGWEKYGGDDNLGNIVLVVGILLSLVGGAAMGWLVMG